MAGSSPASLSLLTSNVATPTPPPLPPSPPPLLPIKPSKGSVPAPPPALPLKNGAGPPSQPPFPMAPFKASAPPPHPPKPPRSGSAPPPPPPPLPTMPSKGSAPPPPMPPKIGAAPPPPPGPLLGASKNLGSRRPATRLKRSSQMGNLYQVLRKKMEGTNQEGQSSQPRRGLSGNSNGGKQGMADTIAEMTKKSAYFQQIEEDVKKHAKSIMEVKAAISAFQNKDMTELLKFHRYVEAHLEDLIDEGQVLARFEGFPTQKLETLRTAAALHLKLDSIVTNLKNWKVEGPLSQQLDKIEHYFIKLKREVEAIDRTKDQEAKQFQSHCINFDFGIIVRLKESMVDLSSSCMELALELSKQERKEMKAESKKTAGSKVKNPTQQYCTSTKLLWRTFHFAFRVYTFAGGQDDHAEELTGRLAHEMDSSLGHS